MAGVSVKFPLQQTGANTGFDNLTTEEIPELVKFNIKNTLLTCPGERTFDDEDFGVCLRKILFEYPGSELFSEVKSRITQQLNKFVPYIVLESVEIANPVDMVMNIKLRYFINEINLSDSLEIEVKV